MTRRKLLAGALALTILFYRFTAMFLEPWFEQNEQPRGRNGFVDVYVPGAGFSGFFYMMGRLQSVKQLRTPHRFHCFSAGCLALTATLLDTPIEDVVELALSARSKAVKGDATRGHRDDLLDDGRSAFCIAAGRTEVVDSSRPFALSAAAFRISDIPWLGMIKMIARPP